MEQLERVEAVPKAAFCRPEERPDVNRHFQTMKAVGDSKGDTIVLVDDVITSGSQMLAGLSRLAEVNPTSNLHGLAIIRALSSPDRFPTEDTMFHPVESGTVSLSSWGTKRVP